MDKAQWAQLSPLLDELLDLEPAARERRLAALRTQDEAAAAALAPFLEQMTAIERDAFLEGTPTLGDGVPDEERLAGLVIGPYTVEREIGQGGMGSVWLARRTDGRYEGSVAIKFLHGGLGGRGGAERFAREGSILARLAHPHIARLIDAGVARAGQPYLVLEYIDGETIDRYCERHALDVAARVRLFLDVLGAVAHAHNRLILHRDIKPSNILVTGAGDVKLLDFGIAKLMDDATVPAQATELTQMAGRAFTPQYAAPEQLQGGDVTTATDVYALGVLLYGLLSGVHPTAQGTSAPLDQMRAVLDVEPRRLSDAAARQHADPVIGAKLARELRGDLDNIVAKALKKAPAERYADAARFADDLRRYLANEPVTARPDAASYRLAKFVRRHRLGVAAGGVIAVALAVGLSTTLWQAHEARRQRVQAEGLIEFMLGDLRKKLQPVGRLDVLDAVGEKALAYYAAQDADQLDAASLGRRARALHLIGEIHEKRGRLDDASDAFQQASSTTARLLLKAPGDGQRVFDHAQSVYWVGYIARRRGQSEEAEAAFRTYGDLAQRLARLDAANLDWRLESAYAANNLGVLYLETGRAADALVSFKDARHALSALALARPELNFDLAHADGWIAKTLEVQGDYEAALSAQRAKLDLLRLVPDAPNNRDVQRLIANAHSEASSLHLALGQAAAALVEANKALHEFDTLLKLDPANRQWLDDASFARLRAAEIELTLGRKEAAIGLLETTAKDVGPWSPADASTGPRRTRLIGLLLAQRARLELAGGPPSPRGLLKAFVDSAAPPASSGLLGDAELARVVAAVELLLGDLLAREGLRDTAGGHWDAVARRLRPLAARGDPHLLTLLSLAELRLGRVAEARGLALQIESSQYRHPEHAVLIDELARGTGAGQHLIHQRR